MAEPHETKKRKERDEIVPEGSGSSPVSVQALLLDIEGTTTSISFVTDVLFVYVRRELDTYLRKHWASDELQADVQALRQLAEQDQASGVADVPTVAGASEEADAVIESVKRNVFWQMDADRKSYALKRLQGHIWKIAYESGEIKGHVYADVVPALKRLKAEGIPIYIYSSGSVEAQRLIFGYSTDGDIQADFLAGNFDTTSGAKTESSSYARIFESIAAPPTAESAAASVESEPKASSLPGATAAPRPESIRNVLFLTDNILEARAAADAGMSTALTVRPGNKPLPSEHPFVVLDSFAQIFEHPDAWQFC
eukprot:TRINITY_DN10016_c0_g1_i1.p1 TRINITY_DN10016_c0_g1~~TRINITY_DN10016_c0_g1_i1.p1  ORF type:complete len:311 (-),score=119.79 TRINITY_DN10016_c0_g1_i1:206-1138(-)